MHILQFVRAYFALINSYHLPSPSHEYSFSMTLYSLYEQIMHRVKTLKRDVIFEIE